MSWIVYFQDGNEIEQVSEPVPSKAEAEERGKDVDHLFSGCEMQTARLDNVPEHIHQRALEKVDDHPEPRPGQDTGSDQMSASMDAEVVDAVPGEEPGIDEDPVEWMPSHFIDKIEGQPTVNRKGYCVIASKYGVSVTAEPITLPSESDWEYAEFRAIATTEDGQEYSGFGSAHVDRGDDKELLGEMAETRALKRSTAWATGLGMTAVEELETGEIDE
jgi:hypothetical protein